MGLGHTVWELSVWDYTGIVWEMPQFATLLIPCATVWPCGRQKVQLVELAFFGRDVFNSHGAVFNYHCVLGPTSGKQ